MSSRNTVAFRGKLEGHGQWVTSITVPRDAEERIITGSRDKSVIVWAVGQNAQADQEGAAGRAVCSLTGHNQAVTGLVSSTSGEIVISASWDKTMKLWDVEKRRYNLAFHGHTGPINSVTIDSQYRQIISGGNDNKVCLWNTKGQRRSEMTEKPHTGWVSSVKFIPESTAFVSAGWDGVAKIRESDGDLKAELLGHQSPILSTCIAPDGSVCATACKDGQVLLWDLFKNNYLNTVPFGSAISAIAFCPTKFWIAGACDDGVKVFDLRRMQLVSDIQVSPIQKDCNSVQIQDFCKHGNASVPVDIATAETSAPIPKLLPWCTSLAWGHEGNMLYTGTSWGDVYLFEIAADY